MSENGFDTEGFSTDPVSGLELIKDWAAFAGVGAYLGATYGYLRLTKKLAPPVPLPALATTVVLGKFGKALGSSRGDLVPYQADTGHAYIAKGPLRVTDQEGVSKLLLFEDGKPLGPARSSHQDVRNLGEGRYSHWGWCYAGRLGIPQPYTLVVFSTSDNTDPRTNGRSYTYEIA